MGRMLINFDERKAATTRRLPAALPKRGPKPLNHYAKGVGANKMLIVLSFWEGDKAYAMMLARLIADLEPTFSESADFLFVARFDCEHDEPAIDAVSRKFNVHVYTSPKRMTGWPLGCNGTFFGAMEWVYGRMFSGKLPRYAAIFNIAADTCPLRKGWIEYLLHEWDKATSGRELVIAGAVTTGGGRVHVNGDAAMLSGDLTFLKWLATTASNMSIKAGWDWHLAKQFESRGWINFPFIKTQWGRFAEFTESDWVNEIAIGTVVFHGLKGNSLLDLCRIKLLG